MITQWRDKKDVTLMSTCVNDGMITVTRAGKEKEIPCVVNFYNNNMGGVDKSDQMLTSYECERKRVKKCYKKIFHHTIKQSVFNAQIIHKSLGGTLSPLKFREQLIHDIIVKYKAEECQVRCGAHGQGGGGGGVRGDCELRLVGRHLPSYVKTLIVKRNLHDDVSFVRNMGRERKPDLYVKTVMLDSVQFHVSKNTIVRSSINERSFMLISVLFWYACLPVSTFLVYTVTYYRCLILNKYQCGVQILPF